MRTSDNGLEFIAGHEGVRYTAYQDIAGHWTIGVGHLIKSYEDYYMGTTITHGQAMDLLQEDARTAENEVSRAIQVDLNQNQFDALVSLAFNIGGGNFRSSTVVKRINHSDTKERIIESWGWWNKYTDPTTGELTTSVGLYNRRISESNLFFTEPTSISGGLSEEKKKR